MDNQQTESNSHTDPTSTYVPSQPTVADMMDTFQEQCTEQLSDTTL